MPWLFIIGGPEGQLPACIGQVGSDLKPNKPELMHTIDMCGVIMQKLKKHLQGPQKEGCGCLLILKTFQDYSTISLQNKKNNLQLAQMSKQLPICPGLPTTANSAQQLG